MSIDQVMAVNIAAPFRLARAAWPHLKKTHGAIVTISSQGARDAFPGLAFYGASKAFVNAAMLFLHREGKADGIRAYAVAPGATDTRMLRDVFTSEQLADAATLAPEDVATVIADCIDGPLRHSGGETIYLDPTRP
jgi:3-oxoacyl-[acyl-carrier protein] reductase